MNELGIRRTLVTSAFTTDLPVNQVDRFFVLGELASDWQVLVKSTGNWSVDLVV